MILQTEWLHFVLSEKTIKVVLNRVCLQLLLKLDNNYFLFIYPVYPLPLHIIPHASTEYQTARAAVWDCPVISLLDTPYSVRLYHFPTTCQPSPSAFLGILPLPASRPLSPSLCSVLLLCAPSSLRRTAQSNSIPSLTIARLLSVSPCRSCLYSTTVPMGKGNADINSKQEHLVFYSQLFYKSLSK